MGGGGKGLAGVFEVVDAKVALLEASEVESGFGEAGLEADERCFWRSAKEVGFGLGLEGKMDAVGSLDDEDDGERRGGCGEGTESEGLLGDGTADTVGSRATLAGDGLGCDIAAEGEVKVKG